MPPRTPLPPSRTRSPTSPEEARDGKLDPTARTRLRAQKASTGASAGRDCRRRGDAALAPNAGAEAPASKWQAAIDARWGPGLPTERKLEIFDAFWTAIDERYAAFQGIEVDWAALRERYRPEVAAGVSRGRFAAIMSHLALVLRSSHTLAVDRGIAAATSDPKPGDPVFFVRGRFANGTFGACATAQDDGSALIYDVAPGHPLGLRRGDRILGYDGRPWPELYRQLLAAELPLRGAWGSSPSSFEHTLVQAAAANWHLFDTIDILKYDSGVVEHRSTAPLNTTPPLRSPFCSEQLAPAGVPKPTSLADLVGWGTIAGTRIGYIYVAAWQGDAGTRFEQAIRELTQERESDGLVIDFRHNRGGSMFLSDAGLGMLFDRPVPTIGFAVRADPLDHFKMRLLVRPPTYVIDLVDRDYDRRSYDRPIAVLTGPNAISSGDQVALRMTYHPRARTFGKSTATAFDSPTGLALDPDWNIQYGWADAYRIEAPHDYLTHDEFPVDQPVWLRPSDVAQGKDTVVDAAVQWINNQTP